MNQPIRVFPPGLVAADGRRIRLGSHVARVSTPERAGEVTGWAGGRRGVEVLFDNGGTIETVPATELIRVDRELDSPSTVGWFAVDEDESSVLLVVPIGTRDLVTTDDPGPFPSPADSRDIRHWSSAVIELLENVPEDQRASLVALHLDAPMLRRVLDEGSLPPSVRRLVFVVTDQRHPQPTDTVGLAPILRYWLRGRGHLDTDGTVRHVEEVGPDVTLTALPHVLDAVVHSVERAIAERVGGCQRVVTVVAGGTPATTYGVVFAATRVVGAANTRTIQVPADWVFDGVTVMQPLIEMDVMDSSLSGYGV